MEYILTTEDLDQVIKSTIIKQKSNKPPTECKICRASAFYSYCSIVVCPSCKVFFKRNAETKKGRFKCLYNSLCEININNRHSCTSCRLEKCFVSGMQVEMLRGSRTAKENPSRTRKLTKISTVTATRNENNHTQQLPTLNLLRSDQSTLTVNQWNLLSNLTHCYDEYSGFGLVQRYTEDQNELPPKMRFKLESVAELFTAINSAIPFFYEKNADFISLCSYDRSILLRKSMKNVAALCTCFITHHTRVLDNPVFYKSAETIYGSGRLANGNLVIDLLDCDGTFVKLVLTLIIFSTFDYIYYINMIPVNLMNMKTVIRIQDMYVELTWKYLLYKYDHERAVICFSNIIRCIFLINAGLIDVTENKQYSDMIDTLIKETEETLTPCG